MLRVRTSNSALVVVFVGFVVAVQLVVLFVVGFVVVVQCSS